MSYLFSLLHFVDQVCLEITLCNWKDIEIQLQSHLPHMVPCLLVEIGLLIDWSVVDLLDWFVCSADYQTNWSSYGSVVFWKPHGHAWSWFHFIAQWNPFLHTSEWINKKSWKRGVVLDKGFIYHKIWRVADTFWKWLIKKIIKMKEVKK